VKHIALLALALALPPVHAAPATAPSRLIDRLGLAVRKVLEDPKSSVTPDDVERSVADRITALIASSPDHPSLTEIDAEGRTPLMQAASSSYAQVVEALLAAPKVRQTINQQDAAGETAWMKASFAPALTLVACQPGTLTRQRHALLPPYLRRTSHLLKTEIGATVRLLEAAGAQADSEAGKLAWLARCPNTSPELRQALADGPLMRTLVNHAVARQDEFTQAVSANRKDIPTKPPEGMKFVRDGVARQRVEGSTGPNPVDGLRCAMAYTRVPHVEWAGEMTFKVVAYTRAGVVEAVDFEGLVRPGERAAADALRGAVLQALRDYRCEGDHVFEQEFQFQFQ